MTDRRSEEELQEERQADAGEYVLGSLSAEERRRIEARMAQDPELRALVGWYRETLIALDPEATDRLPDGLWQRIRSAIGEEPEEDGSPAADITELAAWRRRAAQWRLAAITATAASLLFGALLVGDLLAPLLEPGLLPVQRFVVLADTSGQARYLLEARADGKVLARPVGQPERPDGRALELWSIGADTKPRSLGLLPISEGRMLPVTPAGIAKVSFAVSLEPEGGSPTGAPTGPVVMTQR